MKMFEPKKNKKSSSLRFEHAIKAEALWSKVQSWYLCQATHLETQGFFQKQKTHLHHWQHQQMLLAGFGNALESTKRQQF